MSLPSRLLPAAAAVALVAASLGGCQSIGSALGGGGGVMPATDVGPPPSLRNTMPGRQAGTANVDADGQPLQTAPTRRLDLPKNARADARAAAPTERRIRREDLEGSTEGGRASSSMAPALTPGGSVGLGGKF